MYIFSFIIIDEVFDEAATFSCATCDKIIYSSFELSDPGVTFYPFRIIVWPGFSHYFWFRPGN